MDDHFHPFSGLDKFLQQQRRWQEQMQDVLEPYRRLQEQVRSFIEPERQRLEELRRSVAPQLEDIKNSFGLNPELQSELKTAFGISERAREELAKFQNPFKELQDQLRQYIAPEARLREIAATFEPERKLAEQFQKLFDVGQFPVVKETQKQLEALRGALYEGVDLDTIRVHASGAIGVGAEAISPDELADSLGALTETLADAPNPLEYLKRLTCFLHSATPAVAKFIFWCVVSYYLSVLANLTTPLHQEWWKQLAGGNRKQATVEIRNSAREIYDPQQLRHHRFVTAKRLRVHEANASKSRVIGELPLGKIVKLIQREQYFSLIEYFDSDNEKLCQGWVANSYLSRFSE